MIRLVRRPPAAGRDPVGPAGRRRRRWTRPRSTASDAVVHLSGAPVAGGRWTAARKRELRASRVAEHPGARHGAGRGQEPAVRCCCPAPPSAGTAIPATGRWTSRPRPGTGFLADLVRDWEAAAAPARDAGIRVVNLRSGVVLSRRGGMLGPLLPLFRLGLGARIGPGSQFLSWITLTDHVAAIRFLLDHAGVDGPVNLTAPAPVTNAEFTAALARALHRPALLGVPAPALRSGSARSPASCSAAPGCCRGG